MLKKWGSALLDILYPKNCHICSQILDRTNAFDDYLCLACIRAMKRTPVLSCRFCAQPLAAGDQNEFQLCCPSCAKDAPPYQKLICCFVYEGGIKKLISVFKYGSRPYLASSIARLMKTSVPTDLFQDADVIVPVPLHRARLREREFNQSELIAACLADTLKKPVARALQRIKYTKPQFALDGRDRRTNLAGSFGLSAGSCVKNRSILLIDDIATSTATAQEASKSLKDAGAASISVWAFAKG